MRFNKHYLPANRPHAQLSASNSAWVNYTEDKMERVFSVRQAAELGTRKHKLAADLIDLRQKLPDNGQTLNMYVNDAIGYRMDPEVVLFVSENAYGTADALGFRNNLLRVHDLKTGVNQTTFRQHCVYAAFFCIEYKMNPFDIEIEMRIYQNDDIKIQRADPDEIMHIMSQIRQFDKLIRAMREEGY